MDPPEPDPQREPHLEDSVSTLWNQLMKHDVDRNRIGIEAIDARGIDDIEAQPARARIAPTAEPIGGHPPQEL
jgi:hypothetical protein